MPTAPRTGTTTKRRLKWKIREHTMYALMICDSCGISVLRGTRVWAAVFFLLLLSWAGRLPAQSAAPAAQPSPGQPPTAADQKDAAAKPSPPAKPKKIITNDDLEPHPAGAQAGSGGKVIVGAPASFLNCETACEQEARAALGYDADREPEWQMQVVNARRDLAADAEWRRLLSQAIRQTNDYCNFLVLRSQKVAPSGNSYNARVQRAEAEQYFENTDRNYQTGLKTLVIALNNRIREVSELAPARAAMMNVQASHILDRNCDSSAQQ